MRDLNGSHFIQASTSASFKFGDFSIHSGEEVHVKRVHWCWLQVKRHSKIYTVVGIYHFMRTDDLENSANTSFFHWFSENSIDLSIYKINVILYLTSFKNGESP